MLGLVSNKASNAVLNAINKFERRISGKGAERAGKGFTELISNEEIIEIVKSLEDSKVLIDGVTEAVKHEVKKNRNVDFLVICQHLCLFQRYNL